MKLFYQSTLLLLFLLLGNMALAQITIAVRDSLSGETLTGALVKITDNVFTSDENGLVKTGNYPDTTTVSGLLLGYETKKVSIADLKNQNYILFLQIAYETVEDVVVIGRRNMSREDIVGQIDIINAQEVAFLQSETTADVLEQSGNVFVQKSQLGGGSPILRGFEANKILLVMDGVRLNNAIYRNGHLQNAITVDNQVLEQVEVIHGPGSLIYGSDALGGVIHFKSKVPKFNTTSGLVMSRYSTAASEKRIHGHINTGSEKWAALLSISHADFGNLKSGRKRNDKYPLFGSRPYYIRRINETDSVMVNDDLSEQTPSAYNQSDILTKFKFQPQDKVAYTFNFQYSSSSNIPRYDILTDTLESANELEYAEWFYGPQNRLFLSSRIDIEKSAWFDRSSIILSYQHIEEDRFNRLLNSDWRASQLVDVGVYGLSLDFENRWSADQLICWYGLDFQYNDVTSEAFEENILNGISRLGLVSRYPGESNRAFSSAAYAKLKWHRQSSPIDLQGGVRFSAHHLKTVFSDNDQIGWPEPYLSGISADNLEMTGSLSLKYTPGHDVEMESTLSTGFHFPNIDDFAKIRVRSSWVSVPNPDLQPERSYNGELSIGKKWFGDKSSLKTSITGFYTFLTDAIVRDDFALPNGDSILTIEGRPRKVQANINAENGKIVGVFGGIEARIGSHVLIDAKINYTYGRSIINGQRIPLAHIPPLYGKIAMAFNKSRFKASVVMRYNGKKKIEDFAIGSSDNEDKATQEGSLDWYTVNFYSSFEIFRDFYADVAIENIRDLHYRTFSSGISAPGRNYSFTLRKSF